MGFFDSFQSAVTDSMFDDGSEGYAASRKLHIQFMGVPTGRVVQFKGFLTSFDDQFSSNWNEEEVYGRMDPITTFQGTRRSMSFGFDVPSNSYAEARFNLQRLSLLIAMLYPGYDSMGGGSTSMSSAPLFKVKFSNWIDNGSNGKLQETGLVAAIQGFNFSPDLDAGVFDTAGMTLPKNYSVSCDMTVLHTENLGWAAGEWRGNGAFPYGVGFAPNPDGSQLPDATVTQANDGGASGTDEMQQAAIDEVFDPTAGMTGEFGSSEDVTEFQTLI